LVNPKDIDPFAYQKSTNIAEHNQIVDKINELVDGNNDLNDKVPTAIAQSFDDETRILATTLKTVDGTEITGSVYVPGGGDGGDIVIQNMKYNDKIIPVFDGFFNNLAIGNYNCGFELNVELLSTSDGKTVIFTATELELSIKNDTTFVAFKGTGTSTFGPVGNVVLTKYVTDDETTYGGIVSIYRKVLDEYDWVDFSIDTTYILEIDGYVIRGIKGAAITPYTAGNGITISDNEIAVDTSTIATTAVTTELASEISTNRNLINGTFDDVNISGSHLVFDKVNGEQKEIEIPASSESWVQLISLTDLDTSKIAIGSKLAGNILGGNSYYMTAFNLICIEVTTSEYRFVGGANLHYGNTLVYFNKLIIKTNKSISFEYFASTSGAYNSPSTTGDIISGYQTTSAIMVNY